jgi:Domain of unknown function (DUF6894)
MPCFFFHIRCSDQSLSLDEFGLDFPDVETAYIEAFRAAQDLKGVFTSRDQNPRDYAIEVVTARGELVISLPFSEVFEGRAWAVTLPPQAPQDG